MLSFSLCITKWLFFNWLNNSFFHYNQGPDTDFQKYHIDNTGRILISVIVAPIIETILLQHIPNKILLKLKVTNQWILLLIPSLLFALGHHTLTYTYSWHLIAFNSFQKIPITPIFYSFTGYSDAK